MRLIKILTVGAIGAVAAMALIGTTAAMAENTLLCEANTESETPSAEECKSPKELHFLSVDAKGEKDAKVKLLSSITTVECNALIVAERTSSAAASPVVFAATLSYENCNCTVTVLEQGTISVLKTGTELADVTAAGFKVKVECFGLFTCDYDAENLVGHGLGAAKAGTGKKGHVTYSEDEAHLEQDLFSPFGSCPEKSFLDALFQSLTPVYVRTGMEPTLLCEANTESETPSAEECKSPKELHFLSVDAKGEKDAKVKLLSSITTVECNALIVAERTSSAAASPVVFAATLSYENCNCTVTVLEQGTISVLKTGTELADVTAAGFKVKVECFGLFTCDYDAENLVGHGLGAAKAGTGKKGHVTYSEDEAHLEQDLFSPFGSCPEKSFLDALFQSLTPVYVRTGMEPTLLCEANTESETPSAEECKSPKELHFLSVDAKGEKDAKVKLLSSITTVECNALIVAERTSSAAASPVVFAATLSYENCNCTVTVLEQGTISVLKTGTELADVTAAGFKVKVECFGLFTCDYDAENLVGHGLGAAKAGTGKKGHVTYSEDEAHLEQDLFSPFGSCPEKSFLDALFQSLTPVYVRS